MGRVMDKPIVKIFWTADSGYTIHDSTGVQIGMGVGLRIGDFHPEANKWKATCPGCGKIAYALEPEGMTAPNLTHCPDCEKINAEHERVELEKKLTEEKKAFFKGKKKKKGESSGPETDGTDTEQSTGVAKGQETTGGVGSEKAGTSEHPE